jgi:ABC-type transport system involved in multi-copper enzyme maturation permease subunit
MSALIALVTIFAFTGVEPTPERGGQAPTATSLDASLLLAAPDGALGGLVLASSMVGIIALAIMALSVARDFELGTIRVLLVNEPNRLRFLAGKLAALTIVIAASVTIAALVGAALGLALSGNAEIGTSSWSLSATLSTYVNLTIGALLWGVFGAAIAVIARSASVAITAGVAYFLVGENLLSLVWENAGDWLPAGLLDTFMSGGSPDVAYTTAVLLLTGYVAAAIATLSTVFTQRDITD